MHDQDPQFKNGTFSVLPLRDIYRTCQKCRFRVERGRGREGEREHCAVLERAREEGRILAAPFSPASLKPKLMVVGQLSSILTSCEN